MLLGLFFSGGYSLVVVHGLLIAMPPLVAEHRFWTRRLQQLGHVVSVVVALGL